jgi:nitroimidazol reductase NimA-like FMN-containing flavoprotein (pyridoxamine 5'-phosphate oxidase superfamily)
MSTPTSAAGTQPPSSSADVPPELAGSDTPPPSARTTVRRASERGHYDAPTVHAIVDAAWLCHVAFTDNRGHAKGIEGSEPFAVTLPTACWRVGDMIYIHGSNGSPMMKRLASGVQACVAVTHLDGMVLARSAFSHSMNYRSVVVYGRFEVVSEADKPAILEAFMQHIVPGRQLEVRPGDESELKATLVMGMPLHEASAKIRNWGPRDKEEDADHPAWAGVLPLATQRLAPVPDATSMQREQALPGTLTAWGQQAPGVAELKP